MEEWMQKLFVRYPLEDRHNLVHNPYFDIELSKEEIAKYAEGFRDPKTGFTYCLPKNCFKEDDANYNDWSWLKENNPELCRFSEQFFSECVKTDDYGNKTPYVSKLCVALFRLRKICAFIREANKYQVKDSEGKTSGDTEKIKELRASIKENDPDSAVVLVQAASMQRSINEFFV